MEAGWFAHVTVRPDAVLFVKLVICGSAAVAVVVVPEDVFVVEVVVPDEVVVVGVVVVVVVDVAVGVLVPDELAVVLGATVNDTGMDTLPP